MTIVTLWLHNTKLYTMMYNQDNIQPMVSKPDDTVLDNDIHLETSEGKLLKFGTQQLTDWLHNNVSFKFIAGNGGENSYRARKETRKGFDYWYAYKKVNGKLHKQFIAKTELLTHERLVEISLTIRQPPTPRQPKVVDDIQPVKPVNPDEVININQPLYSGYIQNMINSIKNVCNQLQLQIESLSEAINNPVKSDREQVLETENQLLREQLAVLTDDNARLHNEVTELHTTIDNLKETSPNTQPPITNHQSPIDYTAIRNHVVKNWRIAKRQESRERIAAAIDKFIQELPNLLNPVSLWVDSAAKDFKHHQRPDTYFNELQVMTKYCGYHLLTSSQGYIVQHRVTKDVTQLGDNIGSVAGWLRSQELIAG